MVVHMRHTRAHSGNRRSHHALGKVALTLCAKCKAPVQSHRACASCGTYRGHEAIDVLRKMKQGARRKKRDEKQKVVS